MTDLETERVASLADLALRAERAEAERDLLAQAMWDARTALGFDPDGDTRFHSTDFAAIAANHVREAQEIRADLEGAHANDVGRLA